MSELSREDAIEKVKDMRDFIIRYHSPNEVFVSRMNEAIKVLSARPHGEWKACLDTEYCKCSYCGTVVMLEESVRFHFCPNCGADMREEGESN